MWDVGGQSRLRPLWRHYYSNSHGLIYIVDSNDQERIEQSREILHGMLSEPDLADTKVLILANKQDLPNALSVAEITDRMGLMKLHSHQWYIQGTSVPAGDGLYEGLDWLSTQMCK